MFVQKYGVCQTFVQKYILIFFSLMPKQIFSSSNHDHYLSHSQYTFQLFVMVHHFELIFIFLDIVSDAKKEILVCLFEDCLYFY